MGKVNEIITYNLKEYFILFNIMFGALLSVAIWLTWSFTLLEDFNGVTIVFVSYLLFFLLFRVIFNGVFMHTCISEKGIKSKYYFIKKCELNWKDVRHVAIFKDLGGTDKWAISRFNPSPCILISNAKIERKHCNITTYKSRRQIAIRITPKNIDDILTIMSDNLGMPFNFSYDDLIKMAADEPQIFEIGKSA